MFATTTSATLVGVEARPVHVEAHVGGPKERFSLVGLPDTAVREAKERVRAAFAACSFRFPARHVTINLAPASLPKAGAAFDLPIALGILSAAGLVSSRVTQVVAIGELALDGGIRPVRGVLAAAMVAVRAGVPCLVPVGSEHEAAAVPGARVLPVATLAEAVAAASGDVFVEPPPEALPEVPRGAPDLADVRGQVLARRALEIAAAGGHHLLMVGPPGCGKTMLAGRLPGILPPLDTTAWLEVAAVCAAGDRPPPPHRMPPFRAPHHSASLAAILGGGSGIPVPGELALAHNGVLFLDEIAEYPTNLLDALRQPLEEGRVTIARKGFTVTYPAAAQVVAAANPCPCGFRGDRIRSCECSETEAARYRRRLSGPLIDRFDLRVQLRRPEGLEGPSGESSAQVRARVMSARERQNERGGLNGRLTASDLNRLPVSGEAAALAARAVETGLVTGRGFDRVRRVARTIADLADADVVSEDHVAEALSLRGGW